MKRTAVIMAGGSGERFWPLSRKKRPKQILNLSDPERTMLQESIDRIAPIIDKSDIYIITSEMLAQPIRNSMPEFPPENVVAEPAKRNTAPCLALSAAYIMSKYADTGLKPNEISVAVLTADQLISPEEKFCETVDQLLSFVEQNQVIGTIGIVPTRPETGYGYVEVDKKYDINNANTEIQKVIKFHEKPVLDTAKQYAESGRFYWNSGMFFWRLDVFINEMKQNLPEVGNDISGMANIYTVSTSSEMKETTELLYKLYSVMPNISIDFGLMEKANDVVVARALFNWDDIGAWDSMDRIRAKDKNNNVSFGNNSIVDSEDLIVINSSNEKVVAALGLKDIVIVSTKDAILVCSKDKAQEVKKLVEDIKNKFGDKYI